MNSNSRPPSALRHTPAVVLASLHVLASLLFLAPATATQIELPAGRDDKSQGNVAPHYVCTVCGTRNYTVPSDAKVTEEGLTITWCAACAKEVAHRPGGSTSGTSGSDAKRSGRDAVDPRLRLPPTDASPQTPAAPQGAPGEAARNPAPATQKPSAKNAPPLSAALGGPAAFVFQEVGKARDLGEAIVAQAIESLCTMGDPGREASRVELAGNDNAPRLFVAARTLLRCGDSADVDRVLARLRERLPPSVCAPLIEQVQHADPVRASPRYFASLLEHPTAPMRNAAERALRKQLSPALVAPLAECLDSKRGETRLAAMSLLADIEDPAVVDLAFAHLADARPTVAQAAGRALAARTDPAIDARLLSIAFRQRWILRDGAYALLCILEREDRTLAPILDESHVEMLLEGLGTSDPFVGGTCAAALAGIGFRSQRTHQTAWLDQDVVDRLVLALSGKIFHDDFSALTGPAIARLRLVSGEDFAADGPRWVEWWREKRGHFLARRAWIEVSPGDETSLVVRWRTPDEDIGLLGAGAATTSQGASALEAKTGAAYLAEAEARGLLEVFQREGVLSPERLPGVRGARGEGERTLEISISGRGKTFTFGAGASEPWFERCASAAQQARERNRWQRLAPPGTPQLAFWQSQAAWWAEEHTQVERALRMKTIALASLAATRGAERAPALLELDRLYGEGPAAELRDFDALIAALRDEAAYSERAQSLARLCLRAGRAPSAPGAPGAPGSTSAPAGAANANAAAPSDRNAPPLDAERARRLTGALLERFGAAARDSVASVLAASDLGVARAFVEDPRPFVRAATVPALARSTEDADRARLIALLDDHDPDVEIAAVRALGEARVEAARTALVVRSRLGSPPIRAAALDAISKLGGDYVLDALLLAATAPEPEVRAAAARGLAQLADPASVSLLMSMLAEGSSSAVYAPARAALVHLGEQARAELLRAVHRTNHPARRDAALILAEQGYAEPAPALMQLLSSHPDDAHVAEELAILTSIDFRSQADPASAWWSWYDGVVHDDALAWFRAGLERAGERAPEPEAFRGRGTREGRLFLVGALSRPEAYLAERARRELGRMLARDLGEPPAKGLARNAWLDGLREEILAQRDQ